MVKKYFFLITPVLLLALSGCAGFRELFDESPEKRARKNARRQNMEMRQQQNNSRRRSERDPVRDMFGSRKESAPILQDSNLSSFERRMINEQLGTSDADIEAIREQGERARKSRRDWVFGKNPFE